MGLAMTKEYVDRRPAGLYVKDTSVSLASVVFHFQQGASAETILQKFPALGALENVYGAIAFFLANEAAVRPYLKEQNKKWRQFQAASDPLPVDLAKRIRGARLRWR